MVHVQREQRRSHSVNLRLVFNIIILFNVTQVCQTFFFLQRHFYHRIYLIRDVNFNTYACTRAHTKQDYFERNPVLEIEHGQRKAGQHPHSVHLLAFLLTFVSEPMTELKGMTQCLY